MAGPVDLQWTLSSTTDNFLKVGRDLVRTASTDNVQPISLLACERFGATLAICPKTRATIQVLLKSQTDPVILKFLKAQVGYVKGDSVDLLSRTMAGVNLLALAAALISTSSNFEAGSALEIMILASAADKTLVPTAHHLKDLLDILEPRLNRAGFLNEVLGWRDFWLNSGGEVSRLADLKVCGEAYPCPEGIHQIVAAFRELARVGNATSLVFTVGSCAPWLTAFTKWCLGLPPTIYNQEGISILKQPGSQVTLIHSGDSEFVQMMKIEIIREYVSLPEVIYATVCSKENMSEPALASGMVGLDIFARRHLERRHFHEDLGHRALLQAIPYAMKQVSSLCNCGEHLEKIPSIDSIDISQFEPFPDDTRVSIVMAKYLSLTNPIPLKKLDEGVRIADLPLVKLWADAQRSMLELEPVNEFITRLSYIIADIFALTLFGNSLDYLLLYYPKAGTMYHEMAFGWFDCIRDILLEGSPKKCLPTNLLAWALQLVNHDVMADLKTYDWVGSSFRGQVVFPEIFETQSLTSNAFLNLVCISGVLTLGSANTRRFSFIRSLNPRFAALPHTFNTDSVTHCVNLFPVDRVLWQTSHADDCLQVGVGWSKSVTRHKPFDLLRALSYATLVKSCQHKPDANLTSPSITELRFFVPGENMLMASSRFSSDDKIGIYPVFKDEGLRLLSLCATVYSRKEKDLEQFKTIINSHACLSCLLKVCHLLGCNHVVL